MATLREAALRVLSEAHGALSIDEITQRAQERGLLSSTRKTPVASMGAALYMDIKRNPESPFVQVGPRRFTLKAGVSLPPVTARSAARTSLADQIERHNAAVRQKLLAALKEIHPRSFEHLIARLLERLGYEGVETTRYSGDGGIDINATLTVGGVTSVPTAVQVKRYAGNVSGRVVRELRGAIGVHERGLIITTGGFSKDAINEAQAPDRVPISLVDGEKLVELMVQKGLGVVSESRQILDLDLAALEAVADETAGVATGDKYESLRRLPGGDYLAALNAMMEYIGAESPTADAMVTWIRESYPSVESERVCERYIRVLHQVGLVTYEGTQLVVTEAGAQYIERQDKGLLLDLFMSRFAGMEELLEIIRERPAPLDELHAALSARLGVAWKSEMQTRNCLEWLRSLGAVHKDSEGLWHVLPQTASARPAEMPPA